MLPLWSTAPEKIILFFFIFSKDITSWKRKYCIFPFFSAWPKEAHTGHTIGNHPLFATFYVWLAHCLPNTTCTCSRSIFLPPLFGTALSPIFLRNKQNNRGCFIILNTSKKNRKTIVFCYSKKLTLVTAQKTYFFLFHKAKLPAKQKSKGKSTSSQVWEVSRKGNV